MTTIEELMKDEAGMNSLSEYFAGKMLNTADGSGGDLIPEVFDPEIVNYTINDTPFLLRLQGLGQVQTHRSKLVSTRVKTSGVATSAIGETDNIPTGSDSVYDKLAGLMTTYVTPVKISMMEQLGAQDVTDVRADELRDAILDHYYTLNQDMIVGDGNSNTMLGLKNAVTTNTKDLGGDQLTGKFQIDALCQKVMDSKGSPTAILTTANVKSQLEEILYPNVQVNPTVDMGFGYNVTSYNAPNGRNIPIIVDNKVPHTTDANELYVLTEPQLRLKQLLEPTRFDVPAAFLGTSEVIASMDYFQIRGERFQGRMYGIGTKTE